MTCRPFKRRIGPATKDEMVKAQKLAKKHTGTKSPSVEDYRQTVHKGVPIKDLEAMIPAIEGMDGWPSDWPASLGGKKDQVTERGKKYVIVTCD